MYNIYLSETRVCRYTYSSSLARLSFLGLRGYPMSYPFRIERMGICVDCPLGRRTLPLEDGESFSI